MMASLFTVTLWGPLKARNRSQEREFRQAIWKLEQGYWNSVENNDLSTYLSLWHKDFVGWPSVSAAPVRKDHITDWITSQTNKGLTFKSIEFKPAATQITGSIAVAYYRMTCRWLDKDGRGDWHTIRVTHTWLKEGKDWHIIGGMSMQESANPQN
jgi:ketosteroid isomerase-like protein